MAGCLKLPVNELLEAHTLFPFASCLLNSEDLAIRREAITADRAIEDRSKSPSLLHTDSPRWCPECTRLDVKEHGESHWRVSQNLPGVFVCVRHRCPLATSDEAYVARRANLGCAELPHEIQSSRLVVESARPYLTQLADAAIRRLQSPLSEVGARGSAWAFERASALGLPMHNKRWLNRELRDLVENCLGGEFTLVLKRSPAQETHRLYARLIANPQEARKLPIRYLILQAALELPKRLVLSHLSSNPIVHGRTRDGEYSLDLERAARARGFIDRRLKAQIPTTRREVLEDCQFPAPAKALGIGNPLLRAELQRLRTLSIWKITSARLSDGEMAQIASRRIREHLESGERLLMTDVLRACGRRQYPTAESYPLLREQLAQLRASPVTTYPSHNDEDLARRATEFIAARSAAGALTSVNDVNEAIGFGTYSPGTRYPLLKAAFAQLRMLPIWVKANSAEFDSRAAQFAQKFIAAAATRGEKVSVREVLDACGISEKLQTHRRYPKLIAALAPVS